MIKNFILLFIFILFASCSSNAFTLKKKSNADEFLVEKKSPLVLPPKFLELPQPKDKDEENIQLEEEIDIEKILSIKSQTISETNKSNKTAEDFVLKNIKNN